MKLIVFFIFIPFVSSELHSFVTTYTGVRGGGTPEFFAVTSLDGQQMDYYDSNDETLIPRQDWMKEFESQDQWKEDTEIRKQVQQIYRNNIAGLMERFNQIDGVHVYQRMYGCEMDEDTGESHGFDLYGYDGEDFITLDVNELRYISPVPQGMITTNKWNNNIGQLMILQQYYRTECIEWMRRFLNSRKALESKAPEVFLLQKDVSSPVECQATGFYPSGITITWYRNGEEHHEDVDLGELLPNEDETFQRTSSIYIPPDDWMMNQYSCVVEQRGKTIEKILTEDTIRSNRFLKPELSVFCMR